MTSPNETIEPEPARSGALADRSRTIVLVGLMGSGKSTIGRRLAARVGLAFRDSDDEIEKAAGMSIAEIFETYGEAEFRALEKRVIARLLDEPVHVLATGGGAFVNPETRALIKQRAVSVWLNAHLDVLLERVGRRNTRPLLHNADPADVMRRLMAERHPAYAQADIHIESDDSPHSNTVDAVIAALNARAGWQGQP